jgi:putative GTP pyrophosphokinase
VSWTKPKYTRKQVNRAGDTIKLNAPTIEDRKWAEDVLTNWRASHSYPINTFQSTLRDKLKLIDPNALVAQRLKRAPSIIGKLRRYNSMQLARMQDIGGLRAVVENTEKVRLLEENYLSSRFSHQLVGQKDYINCPKETGYRGIHLIYKYKSETVPEYDGLQLELQIRTRLQHTWATAVETMGTFLNHALKSSEGPEEWLKFFSLTGSAFAHMETCPPVLNHERFSKEETFKLVVDQASTLGVVDKLQAFSIATNAISNDKQPGSYHLVVLNVQEKTVAIQSYGKKRLEEANEQYTYIERRILLGEPLQVVLVSAGSIDSLRRAYPNYFLDTREFINQIHSIKEDISE